MLAVLGLLGAGALALQTTKQTPTLADDFYGSDTSRAVYDNTHATSDDPMLNFFGQSNPIWLRDHGAERLHHRAPPNFTAQHDHKEQQTGNNSAQGMLRGPNLEQDDYDSLAHFRWLPYNSDIQFTGRNGSIDNYHMRWARTLPRDPDPGVAEIGRAAGTLEDTCGSVPPIDSILGPTNEDQYLYSQGGNEFHTGIRHTRDGRMVFAHLPQCRP